MDSDMQLLFGKKEEEPAQKKPTEITKKASLEDEELSITQMLEVVKGNGHQQVYLSILFSLHSLIFY